MHDRTKALMRGADDVVFLTDRAYAVADTLATAYALTCAIRRIGDCDLIFAGRQAIDGDTAQVGPQVAGALGAVRRRSKILAIRLINIPPVAASAGRASRSRSSSRNDSARAYSRGPSQTERAMSSQQYSRSVRRRPDTHQVTGWKKRRDSKTHWRTFTR